MWGKLITIGKRERGKIIRHATATIMIMIIFSTTAKHNRKGDSFA